MRASLTGFKGTGGDKMNAAEIVLISISLTMIWTPVAKALKLTFGGGVCCVAGSAALIGVLFTAVTS